MEFPSNASTEVSSGAASSVGTSQHGGNPYGGRGWGSEPHSVVVIANPAAPAANMAARDSRSTTTLATGALGGERPSPLAPTWARGAECRDGDPAWLARE